MEKNNGKETLISIFQELRRNIGRDFVTLGRLGILAAAGFALLVCKEMLRL